MEGLKDMLTLIHVMIAIANGNHFRTPIIEGETIVNHSPPGGIYD
jgi:hypothetical protein